MSKSNANNPQAMRLYVGTTAATITLPLGKLPKNFIVNGVSYMDQAGIAADNTNFLQLSLKTGATVIATLDTRAAHEGAVTANTSIAMPLDAGVTAGDVTNGAAGEIPAGDLTVVATKNGTGVATLGVITLYGYWK